MQFGSRFLSLDTPRVMGVLNVTPDSFSDGGRYVALDAAMRQVECMLAAGADIIDIGGESTRPGAVPVSAQQELDRVCPVVEAVFARFDVVVSLDTSTPEVMLAGVGAGAGLINDVRALRREGALKVAAALGVPVCLMHMQGEPGTMQSAPGYHDVVGEVASSLCDRALAAVQAGVSREQILLDPGFGFGKTLQHNLKLVGGLPRLLACGYPLLVGVSRKSMIGQITGSPVEERLAGSLALASLACWMGAAILRVHDVKETADVLRIVQAVRGELG